MVTLVLLVRLISGVELGRCWLTAVGRSSIRKPSTTMSCITLLKMLRAGDGARLKQGRGSAATRANSGACVTMLSGVRKGRLPRMQMARETGLWQILALRRLI